MNLFGGVIQINGITYLLLVVFVVILGGYLLGKITIKGTSLSTAGVFIAAIIFGAFFSTDIHRALTSTSGSDITSDAFRIVANIGLCLFVGSVGMIAGPAFFSSFRRNFKGYIIMGVVIIAIGAAVSLLCFCVGMSFLEVPAQETAPGITKSQYMMAMIVGIMFRSLDINTGIISRAADSGKHGFRKCGRCHPECDYNRTWNRLPVWGDRCRPLCPDCAKVSESRYGKGKSSDCCF